MTRKQKGFTNSTQESSSTSPAGFNENYTPTLMLASIITIISNNCEEAGIEKKFQNSDGH